MTFQQIVDTLKNVATAVDSTATFYRGQARDISQQTIVANTNLIYVEDTISISTDQENIRDTMRITLGFFRQDSTSSESMTENQSESGEESREVIFEKTWQLGRQYLQALYDDTNLQFVGNPQLQQVTRAMQGTFTGWACTLEIFNLVDCDDLTGSTGKICSDGQVVNSDATYDASVTSGGLLTLPDITVTDCDGSTRTVPAVTDVVCTPSSCPQTLTVYVHFQDGTDTIVVNGVAGTISTESTDGGSTFTYNGSSFASWNKAWGGDVTIVRSSSSGAEILTLTGTYT